MADNYSAIDINGHFPVMLNEVIDLLQPKSEAVYIDATFGGGGYSKAILSAANCNVWGIDRDPDAIRRGQKIVDDYPTLRLLQGDFAQLETLAHENNIQSLDGIVLDLGVSSFQLDEAERGFSFRFDGPLDMRMSKSGKTAADLVNQLSETELADILWYYGEERFSRRIARAIIQDRLEKPFETTQQLANLIKRIVPSKKNEINPATRSFQALRIAVNDELTQIRQVLTSALSLLKPDGKLIVVSFHSLEDRIVKEIMNQATGNIAGPSRHHPQSLHQKSKLIKFEALTHKPLRPSKHEALLNPRSRSAKLRAIKRLAGQKTRSIS
ncbi:MAG: 16S rRNA (cytosine(1402)-N(4))-methyltransferase RsmH [Commensalibacter sp.]|nr:16S rRNA (cytosine(1402)-N(4))-methyltransferase RsmH [Commensalibacter sp.]